MSSNCATIVANCLFIPSTPFIEDRIRDECAGTSRKGRSQSPASGAWLRDQVIVTTFIIPFVKCGFPSFASGRKQIST